MDTLRTHVTRLRSKLSEASSSATIEGRPGVGYRLRVDQ
jgi:DNA-binding response OmpR family regulator